MIRRPPRSTLSSSSAASDVYKRQLEKLGLNPRQIKAMDHVVKKGSITNREYTSLNDISRKTATVDLSQLVEKGVLIRRGEGKRSVHYTLPDHAKITVS